MFIYFLMARNLDRNRVDSFRWWRGWVESFSESSGAVQTQVFKPWDGDDVPTSQRSVLGEHAALITFHTHVEAIRASRIFADRLRLNAASTSSNWAVLGRLYQEVFSVPSVRRDNPHEPPQARTLPTDHHMYEVSRATPSQSLAPLLDWHKEHIEWHCQTYGAKDAILLSAAEGSNNPLSYPYDVLAIYWFRDQESVRDMCLDLFVRYRAGWPELARWEPRTQRDQSPFSSG
jgi:hypothetical protein